MVRQAKDVFLTIERRTQVRQNERQDNKKLQKSTEAHVAIAALKSDVSSSEILKQNPRSQLYVLMLSKFVRLLS